MIIEYRFLNVCKFLLLLSLQLNLGCTYGKSTLPNLDYDSTSTVIYKGRIYQKEYFLKKELKCRIIYADENRAIYNLISAYSPVRFYDSCYIFYKDRAQDVYLYDDSNIIHDQFSITTPIYKHSKISRKSNLIFEEGNYYIIRFSQEDVYFDFEPKYKIGKWKALENNNIVEIDYDRSLINGKPIVFTSNTEIINLMKNKCDSLVNKIFGKPFVHKFILFNLDKSTFSTKYFPRSPYLSTYDKLLSKTNDSIEFADLCYDIRVNDTLRFNIISLRVDKALNFVVEKKHDIFSNEYKYPCVGLDSSMKMDIFKKVVNFKKIAKSNGFDFNSRFFSVNLKWEPKHGLMGKLYFEMEEIIPINDFQRMYKIIRIDPSNGEIKLIRDDTKKNKNEDNAEEIQISIPEQH